MKTRLGKNNFFHKQLETSINYKSIPIHESSETDIIQDTHKENKKVKSWRTLPMIMKNSPYSNSAWVSLSGQPAKKGWNFILNEIAQYTHNIAKKIIVLDLRQENHGYLNGQAITEQAKDNWVNIGKNRHEIVTIEKNWLASLALKKYIYVLPDDALENETVNTGINVLVKSVQNESNIIIQKLDCRYYRLAVSDHCAPSSEDIDKFLKIYHQLIKSNDTWLHIHCRGGKGRTTTFTAFYLMLKHANEISLNEIVKRLASVNPYYDLSDTNHSNPVYKKLRIERYELVQQFYLFAKQWIQHPNQSWSDWVKSNKSNNLMNVI